MAADVSQDLEKEQVPRITIFLTAMSPLIWLWLNFVSSAGFLALGSQVTLSLATTYMLAIACSLYSRIYQPDVLGKEADGIFQLGKFWGTIADVVGLCFLSLVWVLAWFVYLGITGSANEITDLEQVPLHDADRCRRHQLCSNHCCRRHLFGNDLLCSLQPSALPEPSAGFSTCLE